MLRLEIGKPGSVGMLPTEPPYLIKETLIMLRLAIVFFVVALLAAFFGFGGVANYSWAGAKILFFIFLVLAVLSYLGGSFYQRRTY
jgi:uncharacterized membrane protein YtjA (UPF0391 family)